MSIRLHSFRLACLRSNWNELNIRILYFFALYTKCSYKLTTLYVVYWLFYLFILGNSNYLHIWTTHKTWWYRFFAIFPSKTKTFHVRQKCKIISNLASNAHHGIDRVICNICCVHMVYIMSCWNNHHDRMTNPTTTYHPRSTPANAFPRVNIDVITGGGEAYTQNYI